MIASGSPFPSGKMTISTRTLTERPAVFNMNVEHVSIEVRPYYNVLNCCRHIFSLDLYQASPRRLLVAHYCRRSFYHHAYLYQRPEDALPALDAPGYENKIFVSITRPEAPRRGDPGGDVNERCGLLGKKGVLTVEFIKTQHLQHFSIIFSK
jgi:hypothetical protein